MTMATLTLDLTITPVQQSDIEHLVRHIEIPAFRTAPASPLGPLMFPSTFHSPTEEELQWAMHLLSLDLLGDAVVRKISADGMMIGFAVWSLGDYHEGDAEGDKGGKDGGDREGIREGEGKDASRTVVLKGVEYERWYPATLDMKAWIEISAAHERDKERVCRGRGKILHLVMMAVDPAYQSLGAGTKLMEDGCIVADRCGYDIFITASGSAVRFYERFGCRIVGPLEASRDGFRSMLRASVGNEDDEMMRDLGDF